MNRFAVISLAVTFTAVSIGVINYANAASDVSIKACANTSTGALRLLTKGSCKAGEKQVSWNQQGPIGLTGPQGAAGPQGATGSQGVAGPQGSQGVAGPQGANGLSAATIPTTTIAVPTQRVGDVGPGGGPIFYVDSYDQFPFTYLEVAPSNAIEGANGCTIGGLTWTNDNSTSGALTSEDFGQGRSNTLTLLAMCIGSGGGSSSGYDQLATQIRDGWFVPSVAEMKVLINAEKFGHITLTRPLRQPVSGNTNLMSSSIIAGSGLSGGAPFWSWGYTSPTIQPYNQTEPQPLLGQVIRLIRAG